MPEDLQTTKNVRAFRPFNLPFAPTISPSVFEDACQPARGRSCNEKNTSEKQQTKKTTTNKYSLQQHLTGGGKLFCIAMLEFCEFENAVFRQHFTSRSNRDLVGAFN